MAKVAITIKKALRAMEVDTDTIPDGIALEIFKAGLDVFLNSKMSKVPTLKGLEGKDLDDAKASAWTKAEENLTKVYDGSFKRGRTSTAVDGEKVSREVMTEALRLARNAVKDAIRAAHKKISHFKAADITAAAKDMIAQDPSFLADAKTAIEGRASKAPKMDIATLVHESPELVQKAAAKAAQAKATKTISATQAGKVAPRKRAEATA